MAAGKGFEHWRKRKANQEKSKLATPQNDRDSEEPEGIARKS